MERISRRDATRRGPMNRFRGFKALPWESPVGLGASHAPWGHHPPRPRGSGRTVTAPPTSSSLRGRRRKRPTGRPEREVKGRRGPPWLARWLPGLGNRQTNTAAELSERARSPVSGKPLFLPGGAAHDGSWRARLG